VLLGLRVQEGNADRLHVRPRGPEVAEIFVEHAVVKWRKQRRREDQIGDAVLQRQQSFPS
jgi:hypothetical protein